MARKVVWAGPAADDIVEAVEYIARDSPSYAATLAQQICDAGDALAEFSERGRPYPDPDYGRLRELIIGPYRLVHEVEARRIVIHGVFHGRREASSTIRGRVRRRR